MALTVEETIAAIQARAPRETRGPGVHGNFNAPLTAQDITAIRDFVKARQAGERGVPGFTVTTGAGQQLLQDLFQQPGKDRAKLIRFKSGIKELPAIEKFHPTQPPKDEVFTGTYFDPRTGTHRPLKFPGAGQDGLFFGGNQNTNVGQFIPRTGPAEFQTLAPGQSFFPQSTGGNRFGEPLSIPRTTPGVTTRNLFGHVTTSPGQPVFNINTGQQQFDPPGSTPNPGNPFGPAIPAKPNAGKVIASVRARSNTLAGPFN